MHRLSPCTEISWLHFPKCGTSFGAAMYGLLCESEDAAAEPANVGVGNFNAARPPCKYCGFTARKGVYVCAWIGRGPALCRGAYINVWRGPFFAPASLFLRL